MEPRLPLSGVRIIDFTWVVAGPAATRGLADLGAEVIKVERKSPGFMGPRRVGLQGNLNRNKLSVAINMAEPRGIELAQTLAARGDVVIDNFSARVMRQWGMDYGSLRKLKPDIICISMSGLGHTGPRANYVSYGPTLQALAGYTMMMADSDHGPASFGYSYADMAGGFTGTFATLVALWHKRRTGRGQFVDLSQFEAVTAIIGPALLDIAVNGRRQEPPGYRSQEAPAAPHGVYPCRPGAQQRDRWLAISVRSHSEWRRLVVAIGSPDWASEPRFRTLFLRIRNRAELDRRIAQWTVALEAEDAMIALQRAGVAAGVVADGAYLCAEDPQLKARDYWPSVQLPDKSTTQVDGLPFRLSQAPITDWRCAPEIGDDTNYVLCGLLGLDEAELHELTAANIV